MPPLRIGFKMRQARNEKKKSAWGSGSVPGVCVCVTEAIDSFFYFTTGMNVAGVLLSIHTPLLTKGQSF